MKKLQLLTLSMLLVGPMVLSASQDTKSGQADRKKEITDKINAIKDKQSSADFSNNELESKKVELQKTLQDQITLISSKIPTGSSKLPSDKSKLPTDKSKLPTDKSKLPTDGSDEQIAQKANAQDERTYLKIKLTARKSELQATIIFMQSNLKSKTTELQALNNRNKELQAMISTNKENGKTMSPSRIANLQEQQKTTTNDIAEKTAEIKKMQDQLKQYNSTLTELQKTLNDPTNN